MLGWHIQSTFAFTPHTMSTVAAPAPYSTMYINLSYKGRKLTGAITVTEWLCIEQLVERAGQPMVDRHMKINMVL